MEREKAFLHVSPFAGYKKSYPRALLSRVSGGPKMALILAQRSILAVNADNLPPKVRRSTPSSLLSPSSKFSESRKLN